MNKVKTRGLTPTQKALFWMTFKQACDAQGVYGDDRDGYRHGLLEEETGKRSLNDINRTGDFDRVMYRLASEAGDFALAAQFAHADTSRIGHLIKVCCLQLMQLKGADEDEARRYLGGILDQARIPNGVTGDDRGCWLDLSVGQAANVFKILDTHRRRLLRGLLDGHSARAFLGFDPTVVYQPRPSGGLGITYDAHAYDTLTHVQIHIRSTAA